MSVRYTRVGWQDAPSTDTPIDAANLNHMDNGILALSEEVDTELPLLQEQINDISTDIDTQIDEKVPPEVSSWLTEHVDPVGSAVVVDDSLTIQGAAADAKKTGDEISDLKDGLTAVESDVTDLKEDITQVESALSGNDINEPLSFTTVANEWVTSTGTFETANGWSRTDKLDTESAKSITVDKAVDIALYDGDGTFLNVRATLTANTAYTLSNNVGKIVLYGATATINSATAFFTKTSPIAGIASNTSAIESVKTLTAVNPSSMISGKFILANGNETESVGWYCTPYMDLPFDEISCIKIRGIFIGYAGCAIFDEDKELVLGIDGNTVSTYGGTGSTSLQEIEVPYQDGMRYIRISAKNYSALTDIYVKGYTISGAFERIFELEENVKTIGANVSTVMSESKVLVIGDSISSDAYGSYPKWVTVLMNEGFLPSDTTNSSQHATGYLATYNNEANTFMDRLSAISDKSSYDLVVIYGGTNDYIQNIPMGTESGDATTEFAAAVKALFEYAIQNFTQARICIISPTRTYATWDNSVGLKETAYFETIRTIAKEYCYPVLNLTEESGFCPYISTFRNMWTLIPSGYQNGDGVHPNEEYEAKYLAPMIKHFLQGML